MNEITIRHRPGARVEITVVGGDKRATANISMDEYLDLLQAEAQIIPKILAERATQVEKPKLIVN